MGREGVYLGEREAPESSQPEVREPSHAGHERRVSSLDGLRGLAALTVVFYHSLLAWSVSLAAPYNTGGVSPGSGSLAWWLSDTPLHIVWAGPEMVLVFFVLSGYVLALPAVKRGWSWFDASYYPRRFVRLYVPVWLALVFGVCLHELHESPIAGASWWLNAHAGSASLSNGLDDATLVGKGSSWAFTSVIWSLKYEVEFSILLPIFVAVPLLIRRSRSALVIVVMLSCVLLDAGAHDGDGKLEYLPVFLLGVLLAFNIDVLRPRMSRGRTSLALLVCACLLTASYWWHTAGLAHVPGSYVCEVAGACLAVWLALVSVQATRMLTTKQARWLGSRSYSLYLVHEPIVVAFAFLFVRHGHGWLVVIVAIPVSLVAAEIFWRSVESPSIRLARSFGIACARLLAAGRPGSRHAATDDKAP